MQRSAGQGKAAGSTAVPQAAVGGINTNLGTRLQARWGLARMGAGIPAGASGHGTFGGYPPKGSVDGGGGRRGEAAPRAGMEGDGGHGQGWRGMGVNGQGWGLSRAISKGCSHRTGRAREGLVPRVGRLRVNQHEQNRIAFLRILLLQMALAALAWSPSYHCACEFGFEYRALQASFFRAQLHSQLK